MLTWSPRRSRISASFLVSRSSPLSTIWPATMRPGRSISRITDRLVTLFPQPDSPTTPSGLAVADLERDVVDGLDGAVLREEVGLEALDLEERPDVPLGDCHFSTRCRGSSASRNPSPRKLAESTMRISTTPG